MGKTTKKMYKTIRHGENSLQYTILPQNDEFRLEGKIKSVESTRKPFVKCQQNMKSSSSTILLQKRRTFYAYLGVIFICTVIMGAILIPFLITAECMPNPKQWFLRTKAAWSHNNTDGPVIMKSFQNRTNQSYNEAGDVLLNKGNLMQTSNDMNVGKMVKIIQQNGIEKIILKLNKTTQTTYPESEKTTSGKANEFQHMDSNYNVMGHPQLTITVQALNINNNNDNENNDKLKQLQGNKAFHNNNIDIEKATATISPATATIAPTTTYMNTLKEIHKANEDMNLYVISEATTESTKSFVTAITLLAMKNPTLTSTQSNNRFNQVPLLKGSGGSNSGGNSGGNNGNNDANTIHTTGNAINSNYNYNNNNNKRPAIPPVLVKNYSKLFYTTANKSSTKSLLDNDAAIPQNTTTNSNQHNIVINTLNDNIKQNQTNIEWIRNHWPYIDPSTYFQWNNFKAEDNVLFPALLGFALIGIILVVTICLMARNKRAIVNRMRQRNRNNMAENGTEDNATLLTGVTTTDDEE